MNSVTRPSEKNRRSSYWALALFILAVVVIGGVIGASTAPGQWYAGLMKPPFNPPNWLFAPVWLALYLMIGTAGWMIWSRAPKSVAFKIWVAQQALNWLWSPVFFTWQQLWPAVVIIVTILVLIVAFIGHARDIDRRASWLFVPYALWVGFATLLNISIAALN
jgi:translocator protein